MNIFCFMVFNKYFAGKLILTKENNKLEVFHDNIFLFLFHASQVKSK